MKTELTAASLAKYFDQTLLKPYVSDADFKAFCEESARYHFKMIASIPRRWPNARLT